MKQNKRPDNSEKIAQRSKIEDKFEIRPFKWTEKQNKVIDCALAKETNIVFIKSPPGTGKTLLSTYCSLELLSKKAVSNIVYYRNPVESATKSLGFLSGDYNQKMAPYGMPLFDHLVELLDKPTIDKLFKDERISIDTIGFAKGRTHHVSAIIMEEAEDLTPQELELIMGRLGKHSKLFIIGDVRQANVKNSGFDKTFNLFNDDEAKGKGIHTFEFNSSDCMRSPILKFIVDRFEKANFYGNGH